jgi:DNA repair protein RadC
LGPKSFRRMRGDDPAVRGTLRRLDLPFQAMQLGSLPSEERPRERCHRLGVTALSAVELLALILGGGGSGRSAVSLAHSILDRFGGLRELSRLHPGQFAAEAGWGPARSAAVAAAFELGRRAQRDLPGELDVVESPEDAVRFFAPILDGLQQEAVAVLHLGARHQVLRAQVVALGSLNSASVQPREVFRGAVQVAAAAVVLAHNHPSGDPEPSEEDLRLTRRLRRCGETLGVELLDHVVLGDGRWVSLRERRIL